MNNHSNNTNSLLVEIMIAVLFFALCSTVLLKAFTTVYAQSELAGVRTTAMSEARDMVEIMNASDSMEAALEQHGYSLCSDVWQKEYDGYSIQVATSSSRTVVGYLEKAFLTVNTSKDGSSLLQLQAAAYHPQEVE